MNDVQWRVLILDMQERPREKPLFNGENSAPWWVGAWKANAKWDLGVHYRSECEDTQGREIEQGNAYDRPNG